MSKYDWPNVPMEVKWIATDGLGGRCFGYNGRPELVGNVWHKSKSTDTVFNLNIGAYLENWQDSLEERPK